MVDMVLFLFFLCINSVLGVNSGYLEMKNDKRRGKAALESLERSMQNVRAGVYIISSPDEKRTAHVKEFVEKMGLMSATEYHMQTDKWKFLNGNFAGKLVDQGKIDKTMSTRRAAAGVFACAFSHKKLLDAFLASDNEVAVIFEDDVVQVVN